MPRYFLKLRSADGRVFENDPDPEEHPNIEEARSAALQSIREMASEATLSGRPLNVDAIDITTEDGGVLVTVPVFGLVANGQSTAEIGKELHLSAATVKTHLQHAYEKLGVSDRAAAVAEAIRRGLLS